MDSGFSKYSCSVCPQMPLTPYIGLQALGTLALPLLEEMLNFY